MFSNTGVNHNSMFIKITKIGNSRDCNAFSLLYRDFWGSGSYYYQYLFDQIIILGSKTFFFQYVKVPISESNIHMANTILY